MRASPFESELERLARTLTEQFGVQVVCQGDQAWTDGRRIVVPSVPEPMDEALERMMVGYLDHEMAHVAFSDFQVAEEFEKKHPGCLGMLNVVEDALIERRAMERWPGVRRNLDEMFDRIRPRVRQLIAQRGPFDQFCTAVYMRLSHHQDMMGLEPELVGFEDLLARFPGISSTREAAELAEALLQRWQQRHAGQRQPKSASEASPPAAGQTGDGGTDPSPQDEKGSTAGDHRSNPGSQPAETHAESDSEHGENAGNSADDTTREAGKHVPSGRSDASQEPSGSQPTAPEAAPAQVQEPGGQTTGVPGTGAGGRPGSIIGEAVQEAIAEQVRQAAGAGVYRPFTRQHDHIETVKAASDAEVQALLDTGRDTVRRLRRGLTNALRSAEKRWWRDDQLRGELSPRTLHRLCMDRPRLDVFRVRSMVQGESTAVSILLDASGSMSRRKMDVARDAMRVLIEALADLRIPTEALTFTTGNAVDISELMQQTGLDAARLRERYGRLSNLEIGLVQQFGEPARAALSRLPGIQGSGLTPLGEAMQIAAARLAPRPETRRILLVLTDGKAGCEGGGDAATVHAQEMAGRITKAGIELIGVGILDENIREVAADSIVIGSLEDLPAQLCKLLGRTLMRGVRRVG
jgi:cobalamin biosynthesis protein CobT